MEEDAVWTDGRGIFVQYVPRRKPERLLRAISQRGAGKEAALEQAAEPNGAGAPHALWINWSGGRIPPLADRAAPARLRKTINERAAAFKAMTPERIDRALRRSGLASACAQTEGEARRTVSERILFSRRYKLYVFHLRIAAVVRLADRPGDPVGERRIDVDAGVPLFRKMTRTAVRAAYSLGIDAAEVIVAAREQGRLHVESVSLPCARMADWLAEAYAEEIVACRQRFAEEEERTEPAVLGMDPEFILFDSEREKVVAASRYLQVEGAAGCDAFRIARSDRTLHPLAELRPEPSAEPRRLVVHLMRTMRLAARQITDPSLHWLAGGMPRRGWALGGHIHFSGIWLNAELLRVLDNYMALPLALIEDRSAAGRRPRYGSLGDFREQPHGGFEYRTLPSWIVSPVVTKGVVALAQLLAMRYRRLNRRPAFEERVLQAYCDGDADRLYDAFPPLYDDLSRLDVYARYADYIEPLMRRIIARKRWDEQADIRRYWKIGIFS